MILRALASVEWWQVLTALTAAGMIVAGVVLALDARRRDRRREDRIAYKAFMQPKWDEARREVGL